MILGQSIPRDAAKFLREVGYQCDHVGDIGMSQASDEEILGWAGERGAVVVTLDADFHTILALSGAEGPSVVRVRIEGLKAEAIVELLNHVLMSYKSHLESGTLVTVKSNKTTQHRLPIGSRIDA